MFARDLSPMRVPDDLGVARLAPPPARMAHRLRLTNNSSGLPRRASPRGAAGRFGSGPSRKNPGPLFSHSYKLLLPQLASFDNHANFLGVPLSDRKRFKSYLRFAGDAVCFKPLAHSLPRSAKESKKFIRLFSVCCGLFVRALRALLQEFKYQPLCFHARARSFAETPGRGWGISDRKSLPPKSRKPVS
jgi:hypothetical protein